MQIHIKQVGADAEALNTMDHYSIIIAVITVLLLLLLLLLGLPLLTAV